MPLHLLQINSNFTRYSRFGFFSSTQKFDCSFRDGEVRYYHEGNPLLNVDTVRMTIFFFRNNHSIIQTVDIPVDILDPPKLESDEDPSFPLPKIRGPLELNVKSIKTASQAISSSVVEIE